MGTLERKEREKQQRKEEILDAAQKVFFQRGLQASTLEEIAEASELSKGTVYLYYRSKEDLYLGVMVRGLRILFRMLSDALSTEEPIPNLIAKLADRYYEFFTTYRQYFRMVHFFSSPQFQTHVSKEMRKLCKDESRRIWTLLVDLIRRGIDEGTIKPEVKPEELAVMLWSSSHAMMMRIDYENEYWLTTMNIDLATLMKKQNTLLLKAVMTENARAKL